MWNIQGRNETKGDPNKVKARLSAETLQRSWLFFLNAAQISFA